MQEPEQQEAEQERQRRLEAFIAQLPKAELHLHLEGTLEPELMMELAACNGVPVPYADVAAATRAREHFGSLQNFLDQYYSGISVLRCADDFYRLADACLARLAAEGVKHAELFFDPQAHTGRGVPWAEFFPGLLRAVHQAPARHGVTAALIMCFLRDLGPQAAAETLQQALPFREHILGVGLDSAEAGHPPHLFEEVFARAAELGWHRVAHAGEEGGPEYVAGALDSLRVERIDHGVRCLEDPALLARLEARGTPLTLCPLSNLCLQVYAGRLEERLRALTATDLVLTVNSDDPAYFGGWVNANYSYLARAAGLSAAQLAALAANSFAASFALDPAAKARHAESVAAALREYEASGAGGASPAV